MRNKMMHDRSDNSQPVPECGLPTNSLRLHTLTARYTWDHFSSRTRVTRSAQVELNPSQGSMR